MVLGPGYTKKVKYFIDDSIKSKGKRKQEIKCYDNNDVITLSGYIFLKKQ